MKRMIKYNDIKDFSAAVKAAKKSLQYTGKVDDDGNPIKNRNPQLPKVNVECTEKIHGCFEKDTLITLANGEVEKISEIIPGTFILSHDINLKRDCVSEVTNVINQKLNKKWVKLFFDNDTFIKCTEDHKIYTINKGFVEASKLTPDDIFLNPSV